MAKNWQLEKLLRETGIETEVEKLQLQVCNLQTLESLHESLANSQVEQLTSTRQSLKGLIATEDLDFLMRYFEKLEDDSGLADACHFKLKKIKAVLELLIKLCHT